MTQPIMTNFVRKDRPQPSDPDYASMSGRLRDQPGEAAAAGRGASPHSASQQIRRSRRGVMLKPSRGEHGTVFVTGRDGGAGAAPAITLSAEHYNMIARMLEQNVPVKLRVNVQTKFYDATAAKPITCWPSCPAPTRRCATKW